MRTRRTAHLLLSWAMVCLLWFAALAPTVSHLRHGMPVAWDEICSVNGGTDNGSRDPGPAGDPLMHCPFCLLQAQLPLLPGTLAPAVPALARHEAPVLFLQAGRTLHAWVAAQPRGPPSGA